MIIRTFIILALASALQSRAATTLHLAWDANSETNVVGYRLYWGTAQRDYIASNVVDAATTQSSVSNLVAGTRYHFAVTAFSEHAESGYSDEVTFDIPPVPPKNLHVSIILQTAASPHGPWTNVASMAQLLPVPPKQPSAFFRAELKTDPK